MTTHVEGASGTRGNGQKAVKQLESKYLKNTNKMIPATQEALATTSMTSGQDLDHINELTRLRNLLTEMEERITDRHFTDIVPQDLTEEYMGVKLDDLEGPRLRSYSVCTTPPLPGRVVVEQDEKDCWSWHSHDSDIITR